MSKRKALRKAAKAAKASGKQQKKKSIFGSKDGNAAGTQSPDKPPPEKSSDNKDSEVLWS